jgi:hypothetical protein
MNRIKSIILPRSAAGALAAARKMEKNSDKTQG